MALWKKKVTVVDLRSRSEATDAGICPSCGVPGTPDYVDLVLQTTSYACPRCARLWDTAMAYATT